MVLDKINSIDWSKLKQAHGYCDHVPEAIKGLMSADSKIQEESYWKLDNHIVLQGDIYQGAFYTIPFLVEVLNSSEKNGRNYIYDLLFEINNGYSPDDISCWYNDKEYPLTEACKISIADSFRVYLKEVANPLSPCRKNALELLSSLEFYKFNIIDGLSIIKKEEKTDFSHNIDLVLAELKGLE